MIYPSYRVIDAEGNFRSFFWFCFARLQHLDNAPNQYNDFLGENYQDEGRRPLWDFEKEKSHHITGARDVVRIEVAFHVPDWQRDELGEIFIHPLFSSFTFRHHEDFFIAEINTPGLKIQEIMYPLFMIRNILSTKGVYDLLENKGLSVVERALLSSQLDTCKNFGGKLSITHISDDYHLAETFEGLAMLLNKVPDYTGASWGDFSDGYVEGGYCSLPDTSFGVESLPNTQYIEDVMDEVMSANGLEKNLQIIVDCFKQAMETVNEKA